MRRFALFALVMLALGCAPSNPAIVIDGLLAAPDNCVFSPASNVFALVPVLDTNPTPIFSRAFGIRYFGTLRVTSRLLSQFNNRYPLRAEPNVLSMNYVEVQVLQVDGTPYDFGGLPNPYRVVATGTIAPGTAASGTAGVVGVELLPRIYGDALANQTGRILLSLRIAGTTSGGATIISGEYLAPIDLCVNCLYGCDVSLMVSEPSCFPGQDGVSLGGLDVPACAALAGP
jgi:hypothetical protein